MSSIESAKHQALLRGLVIPACPLVLNQARRLDEARQRRLIRYYLRAGVGGLAVGVHTTQFAIRDPEHGLLDPILRLAVDEMGRAEGWRTPALRIAGVCGRTAQATQEAQLATELGYDAVLLSLAALQEANEAQLLEHCRTIAEITPVIGFYLQPAVGGRVLPYSFWRSFAEINNVIAIKIAPFNRYQTIDVVRAVISAERSDIALYTGNDDNIIQDLLTPFRFEHRGEFVTHRIVGGLLGQWAVWTQTAVKMLHECHDMIESGAPLPRDWLRQAVELTDANAAFFDAANGFKGCIAGLHEVLARQGLLEGIWCLDPSECLSAGQSAEIDRVCAAYPHLADDVFVRQFLESD